MADKKHVLVIDDQDMIRDVIKNVLSQSGYTVVGAANGAAGLKVLEMQQVDLVITDILMPEMEGIETIIEVRKSHPEIKIMAISGGGRSQNFQPLRIAGKIGADITLAKPFEAEDLLSAVEKLFAPSRARATRTS